MTLIPPSVPSQSPDVASSPALEASRIVIAGGGILFGFWAYNSFGSTRFIQLHDSATLPTDTSVPIFSIPVATLIGLPVDFGQYGLRFKNGIVICNSSTCPTKTIGVADSFFSAIRYRGA